MSSRLEGIGKTWSVPDWAVIRGLPPIWHCSPPIQQEPIMRVRHLTLILIPMLVACGPSSDTTPAAGKDYVYLWTASADSTQPDFLAVLDVTEDSKRYGELITTLPVPGLQNAPHHTEHELPADRQLFANGFSAGRTFIFDLTLPDAPMLAGDFGDVDGYTHPHSFLRLPSGNVLATFQRKHTAGQVRTGGLVELTPQGELVRSSSADSQGANPGLRVYSASVITSLDRIVTTSTDMEGNDLEASRTLQVWRLSDLELLSSITLAGPNSVLTAEPRLLEDGKTLLVSTFSCGLFLVDGLETPAPSARQVSAFPRKEGTSCAVPAIIGNYYLVTVPAWSAVVSLDISDPTAPREVSRVAFAPDDVPHWISVAPDGKRVVVTGYAGMQHRVEMLRFDPASGQLTIDTRFREDGATVSGFRMDDKTWPHGGNAKGVPHGAVFSRP